RWRHGWRGGRCAAGRPELEGARPRAPQPCHIFAHTRNTGALRPSFWRARVPARRNPATYLPTLETPAHRGPHFGGRASPRAATPPHICPRAKHRHTAAVILEGARPRAPRHLAIYLFTLETPAHRGCLF